MGYPRPAVAQLITILILDSDRDRDHTMCPKPIESEITGLRTPGDGRGSFLFRAEAVQAEAPMFVEHQCGHPLLRGKRI